jgi:hypothetical protein
MVIKNKIMIKIDGYPFNSVGLGNRLFIYAYTRVLAENLNYGLVSPSFVYNQYGVQYQTPNVEHKFKDLEGLDFSQNEQYGIDDSFSNLHKTIDNAIDFFQDKNYHIISNGYYQKYSYWKNHKEKVKTYFDDFISTNEFYDENKVAIHLRNCPLDKRFKLPEKYYIDSIEKIGAPEVYLYADNFGRYEELLKLLEPYNPKLMETNEPDTFKDLTKYKNIICSQGSFSFWVGFLSKANKIIYPIASYFPNAKNDNNIDYIVDDEDRYEYVMID